ncbi:mechanosensitive ion channel family protein [Bacillus solitudinis]|uniref:mechanosensitive ion channel family protein n=1 Tax=Bacillus solitudinis TaxID=2014074 RepID=UPI001D0D1E29|nr:mechanosensitive ion channel family protein [Bacillus solitudinis]
MKVAEGDEVLESLSMGERLLLFWNNLDWVEVGIALAIFLVFIVFRKLFTKYIFKIVIRLASKTPTEVFTNLLLSFERPLRVFWIILGTYLALAYLPFHITTFQFVQGMYRSVIIILLGWGLYNFTSTNSSVFFRMARKIDLDEHSMLVPFVSKLLRFGVIAITVVIVGGEWGYNINGFVAGLGLGGLAFALAAQETIGNFFGGIIIITEKPFSKGDWIETPTVEGIVEDITFRSTQIRTFADSVITVPNSTLSNEPITNWSKMNKRRVTFSLGVMYSTPKEKLEVCTREIEGLLKKHEEIDPGLILVRFNQFSHSSLDIFIYFFTKTTAWAEWLRVKEEINFEIIKILERNGVSIAFPSRSIYVESDKHFLGDISEDDRQHDSERS